MSCPATRVTTVPISPVVRTRRAQARLDAGTRGGLAVRAGDARRR